MITVLAWFWQQPEGRARYSALHVNIWAAMVRRHLTLPHRVCCVTETPEGIDPSVTIIKPPGLFEDWRIPSWAAGRPQCLRRLAMFAPDAGATFGERFVCMDLDCVVTGALDPLFADPHPFRIFSGTASGRLYNGSMMMLEAGARPEVFERLTLKGAIDAGRKFIGSDQAWISHCLGPGQPTWTAADGVEWWSDNRRPRSATTRLIFFPGRDKPWSFDDALVRAHYRGAREGRCLILGYGPSLWADVAAALGGAAYDVVIASPEAAAHWPHDVAAIGENDEACERLAEMMGFADVVFCGRSAERKAA